MELKRCQAVEVSFAQPRFNRTFMELKPWYFGVRVLRHLF